MLTRLYKLTTPWVIANSIQIYKNRVLGKIANVLYPLYCKACIPTGVDVSENNNVIVSLTSYPGRIKKIHLCIFSLLNQTVRPQKVILWLAASQFSQKTVLPAELLELEQYGLEIRFCEDIRSYKKIFYAAQEYKNYILVTADDDTLYPENWLEGLINTSNEYTDCVVCYRAHLLKRNNNKILPYDMWDSLSPNIKGPDRDLVPIGVGGVLYPVGFFDKVKFDIKTIQLLCPTADDLWLKALGLMNDYNVVKVNPNSTEWFTIIGSQRTSLMKKM